ncbi:hypothetical protein F4777DRAFT_521990 [Nemania sp. FL0916]|nr:hypothetical protein F4777DRAFT_521990 [Nemania sp. FL0916]
METSAPKRRKTSPTTNVPVNESNEPSSSDSATRRSSRLNRPSFASPTKASLARSNPDILQRRASSRAARPSEDLPPPAASEPGSPSELVTAQLELESETGRLHEDNEAGNGTENDAATAERPASPVRRAGGGLSLKPKRTPTKPSPRPLPPPDAEEEELIYPFKGRGLRRSPPRGVLPPVRPEEPELPPTPTQKGLSDPSSVITSPLGIHNSPSKRPRRSRILAAKINSSPLKQPPLRPPESGLETVEEIAPPRLTRDPLRHEPRRRRSKRKSHPGRQIEEPDPLADKKALRDSLLTEIAGLEADLRVATRENERLYHAQRSHRHAIELPDDEEQDRLLDVLRRHALPPEKQAPPDPMQEWLEAAMNPIAFLPFGRAGTVALPPLITPNSEADKEADAPLPPPTSHHPIAMTADEELPYLQVFTPLTFTSTITTIRDAQGESEGEAEAEAPLLQRHAISVASSPPGLFVAAIDMLVDTKTLSVTDLAVPRLDPAAAGELDPFLHTILRKGSSSSSGSGSNGGALTRNIGIVTWAMGEWLRVATRRAHFWHAVTNELGSTDLLRSCARAMREKTTARRKTRGRPANGDKNTNGEANGGGDDDGGGGAGKKDPKKAVIVALLGRTSFDLDLSGISRPGGAGNGDGDDDGDEPLTARILWRVEFDWTGEARSKIAFLLKAPAKWHASDEKKSLAGLPDMFDKLLRDNKDPLEALKIVVALIAGDGRP